VEELRTRRRCCRCPKQKVHVLADVQRDLDGGTGLRIHPSKISVVHTV